MHRDFRISPEAKQDYNDIEDISEELFGPIQSQKYTELLLVSFDVIAAEPHHVASRPQDDIFPGLRSFHLRHAKKRARASHVIFYHVSDSMIYVLRILHQSANIEEHF